MPDKEELDDLHDHHNRHGEAPDNSAMRSLQLAHRAIAKFPDLARRYQKFIGTVAVVSSALIVLSSIAVSKRIHRGESDETILDEITPHEIENAGREKPNKPTQNRDRPMH